MTEVAASKIKAGTGSFTIPILRTMRAQERTAARPFQFSKSCAGDSTRYSDRVQFPHYPFIAANVRYIPGETSYVDESRANITRAERREDRRLAEIATSSIAYRRRFAMF